MIKVDSIDYDLSLKLGDPRDDTGDGQQFKRQDRLKYLGRAYGRLLRVLEKLAREYQPLFSKMKAHAVIALKGDETRGWRIEPKIWDEHEKGKYTLIAIRKIDELYVELNRKVNGFNEIVQAIYVNEDSYITTILGKNEMYIPDYDKGKIFYSYFSGGIQLMPQKVNGYVNLHMVYQKDVPEVTMESVLEVSNDYRDLLITMAAKEGMEDIARSDKVQLYTRDIDSQLQILGIATAKAEGEEGAKSSG